MKDFDKDEDDKKKKEEKHHRKESAGNKMGKLNNFS